MIVAALIPAAVMLAASLLAFGAVWFLSSLFRSRKVEPQWHDDDAVSPEQAIEAGRCLIRKRRDTLRRA